MKLGFHPIFLSLYHLVLERSNIQSKRMIKDVILVEFEKCCKIALLATSGDDTAENKPPKFKTYLE